MAVFLLLLFPHLVNAPKLKTCIVAGGGPAGLEGTATRTTSKNSSSPGHGQPVSSAKALGAGGGARTFVN